MSINVTFAPPRPASKAAASPDAEFWMSVDLDKQTEMPHGVGHMLVFGIPSKCPECKKENLKVTSKWLEVKCASCGHTERHTRVADATWIATWATIQQPANRGCGDERPPLGSLVPFGTTL